MRIAIVTAILLLVGVLAGQYMRSHERRCTAILQERVRDWPQFNFYREANEQLLAQHVATPPVVFLGDSITYGWDLKAFFPNQPYVNRGIEGQTSAQMLLRFRTDVLALHPRQVVIQAGTNDIEQQMSVEWAIDNLTSMAELAHDNRIRVVFLSVLPVYDISTHKRTASHPLADTRRINQWLQLYAGRNGDRYVDCFREMAEPDGRLNPAFSDDGLHPNAAGYKIISTLVQSAIERADRQRGYP
jgi:acyl-CoA thioesterase-1